MTILLYLIPLALLLGGIWLAAFFWCLRSGQYNDLDGDGWRSLEDGEPLRASGRGREPATDCF